MDSSTALARQERRIMRSEARIKRLTEELEAERLENEAAKAGNQLTAETVTPIVRSGLAWGTSIVSGVANALFGGLPEAIVPGVLGGAGIAVQLFADPGPDLNEAAIGVADGGGSVLFYILSKGTAQAAMDAILNLTK